jgi:hypothetical protein
VIANLFNNLWNNKHLQRDIEISRRARGQLQGFSMEFQIHGPIIIEISLKLQLEIATFGDGQRNIAIVYHAM